MDSESVWGRVVQSTMSPVYRTTHAPQPPASSEPASSRSGTTDHPTHSIDSLAQKEQKGNISFPQWVAEGYACVSCPPHSQGASRAHSASRRGSRASSDRVAVRH